MICPNCDGRGYVLIGKVLGNNPGRQINLPNGGVKCRMELPDTIWGDEKCDLCLAKGYVLDAKF
jgi:hypothetical protein